MIKYHENVSVFSSFFLLISFHVLLFLIKFMLKFKILCIGLLLFCSFTMTEEAYKDTSDPQKEDKPLPISKAMPIVD